MNQHCSLPSFHQEDTCPLSWPYPCDTLCEVPCSNTFDNKLGLSEDLAFLTSMPEFCDVTFMAGTEGEPVHAVRAILAARSRVLRGIILQAANGNAATSGGKKKAKKDKRKKGSNSKSLMTIPMKDFDPDAFRELIQYLHTGKCSFEPSTVIGLMNACDYFGIEELKRACLGYVNRCVEVESVLTLLETAEQYISHKYTKIALKPILEFIDTNAEAILALDGFSRLSQHVATLVFGREQLQVSSYSKFQSALAWCKHHQKEPGRSHESLEEIFAPFVDYVALHEIPAMQLMNVVKPCGAVRQELILNALAFQADPESVDVHRLSFRQRLNSSPALAQPSDSPEEDYSLKISSSLTSAGTLTTSTSPPRPYGDTSPPPKVSRTLPSTPEEEPATVLAAALASREKPPLAPKPSAALVQDMRSRLDGSNVHINKLKFHADKAVSETALNVSNKHAPVEIAPIDTVIECFRSSSQLSDNSKGSRNLENSLSRLLTPDDEVKSEEGATRGSSECLDSAAYNKSSSESSETSQFTKSTSLSPTHSSHVHQTPNRLLAAEQSGSEESLDQFQTQLELTPVDADTVPDSYTSSHSSLYSQDSTQLGPADMSDVSQVSINEDLLPKLEEVAPDAGNLVTNETWSDSFDSSETQDPSPLIKPKAVRTS